MKDKVNELLVEVNAASGEPGAYGLLPDIARILEIIQGKLESDNPDPEALLRGAGALGRVVTDNYSFSESPLGTKLLELVTEIVSHYDPSFRQLGRPSPY